MPPEKCPPPESSKASLIEPVAGVSRLVRMTACPDESAISSQKPETEPSHEFNPDTKVRHTGPPSVVNAVTSP